MTDRQNLKSLRPQIPTIFEAEVTSSLEVFQNQTLRPILKLQNDLLVEIFQHYIQKRKNIYGRFSEENKLKYIEDTLHNDLNFRNLLIGTIVGHWAQLRFVPVG